VLNRFGEFFRDVTSIDAISGDDLTRFVVTLKRDHKLGANTVLHNPYASTGLRRSHGAALDGAQVARNYNALSGSRDRRSRQAGLGEDPFVIETSPAPRKAPARETVSSRKARLVRRPLGRH
jgi:hypothetical protein